MGGVSLAELAHAAEKKSNGISSEQFTSILAVLHDPESPFEVLSVDSLLARSSTTRSWRPASAAVSPSPFGAHSTSNPSAVKVLFSPRPLRHRPR